VTVAPTPYYAGGGVVLYHGDHRDILPGLGLTFDLIIADPPYGETALEWDRWPDGWPSFLARYADAMWCTGSMRMFLERAGEFSEWTYSQDVIWEKHNGSNPHADRFRRIHEHGLFWYRGKWADRYHETPVVASALRKTVRRQKGRAVHFGSIAAGTYVSEDGGPLLMSSIIAARSMHGSAINETEKPVDLLFPLLEYACPMGGLILDPFAGSASTLDAARMAGRRAVGIEKRESQCEAAAHRLAKVML